MNGPGWGYLFGGILIALGVGLQFMGLYQTRLAPLAARYPLLKLLYSRLFQLGAGFALLTLGIEML